MSYSPGFETWHYLSLLCFSICKYYILCIVLPTIPFKVSSQMPAFFLCLTCTTVSEMYSLLTVHAASSYFYSMRSNPLQSYWSSCRMVLVTLLFWPEIFSGLQKKIKIQTSCSIMRTNFRSWYYVCVLSSHPYELLPFPLNTLPFPIICHFSIFQQFPLPIVDRQLFLLNEVVVYNIIQSKNWMSNKTKFWERLCL